MAAKKEAAAKKEVATKQDAMPAFLKNQDQSRGSEEVAAEDLVIPRLDLAQALSPAANKKKDEYIDGCEPGMFFNNVTREVYGDAVTLVPVYFRKEYLLWRDRDKDTGGFNGAFSSQKEAEEHRQSLDRPENVEVVDTNQHFCLIVKEDGTFEEIVVSMAKSKAKASRNWNSLIRINGGDRFSRMYVLKSFSDQNNSGDDFENVKVENKGWVTEELYNAAETLYDSVKSGKASVDRTDDTATSDQSEAGDGEF